MLPPVPGAIALAILPVLLILLRNWPRLLCGVALAGCALPFLLTTATPFQRLVTLLFTSLFLIKMLLFATGHVRPRRLADYVLFILTFAVVRWETPRQPDPRRAGRTLLISLGQFGLAWMLMLVVVRLDPRNPVQLFTAQVGFYLVASSSLQAILALLSLRGLDYDDLFNNPLASLTPAEFWGRRWNTWISDLLYRYVFLPVGGRRHPARGTMAAFAVSGAYHELLMDVGMRKFNGGMLAYFLLQGGLVLTTARSRFYRRLAREAPVLAWGLTTILMLLTGVLFVRGMDGVDPSRAWHRVFG